MRINRSLYDLPGLLLLNAPAAYAMNCDWQNLYARPTGTHELCPFYYLIEGSSVACHINNKGNFIKEKSLYAAKRFEAFG